MDAAAISQYITETFVGTHAADAWGDAFFYYNPHRTQSDEFYFATLKTQDDDYDKASDLNRPDVFRLNIGLSKASYEVLFGQKPRPGVRAAGTASAQPTDYDFTALDQILPHPVYGKLYWISVLNPSNATFERVKPLLAEAYKLVVEKYEKKAAKG